MASSPQPARASPESGALRRIFISYRREDSAGHVLALMPTLRGRFGDARVFKDTDSIPPGQDFVEAIQRELASCVVMLVVIGREWLTVEDPRTKRRRLDDPNDLVRIEVAIALANPRVLVVPVLVRDANMPAAEDLPADLQLLARRNAVELTDTRWNSDTAHLLRVVEQSCGDLDGRVSRLLKVAAAAVVVLAIGLLSWFAYVHPRVAPPTASAPEPPSAAGSEPPVGTGGNDAIVHGRGPQDETALQKPRENGQAAAGANDPASRPSGTSASRGTAPPTKQGQPQRPPPGGTLQGDAGPSAPPADGSRSGPDPAALATQREAEARARREDAERRDRADIADALERFRDAYSRKDEHAIRQVYPDVRTDKMFRDLRDCARLSLAFDDVQIGFISTDAAVVDVRAVYGCQPRTGQGLQLSTPVSDSFRFERRESSWVIARRLISLD